MSRLTRYKTTYGYTATPENSNPTAEYYKDLSADLHEQIFGKFWERIGISVVPVGNRGIPVRVKGDGIPPLVAPPATPQKVAIPPPIDRRDVPQDQKDVQMKGFEWRNVGGRWSLIYPSGKRIDGLTETGMRQMAEELGIVDARGVPRGTASIPAPVSVGTQPPERTMDLGNLIGDIAKTYITTRYAPTPVSTPINYMPADFQVGPLNVDPMDLFTQDTGAPVVSFGKKKTCRRRRRRLATMSDIKDLAALKSVLGNGEAFKTWIATHSR